MLFETNFRKKINNYCLVAERPQKNSSQASISSVIIELRQTEGVFIMVTVRNADELGISRLGMLVTVLFAVCVFYAGYSILPFYYYYHELQGLAEHQTKKSSILRDDQIRKTMLKRIKEMNIPLEDPDDELKIYRTGGNIVVEFKYTEVFFVDLNPILQSYFEGDFSYNVHEFPFHVYAEAPSEK